MVAAVERFAFAPSTATDNSPRSARVRVLRVSLRAGLSFRNDVCAVGDELAIHAKYGLQRSFDLSRSVVLPLQAAHGSFDEFTQERHVFRHSKAQPNLRRWTHSNPLGMLQILLPVLLRRRLILFPGLQRRNTVCLAAGAIACQDAEKLHALHGD